MRQTIWKVHGNVCTFYDSVTISKYSLKNTIDLHSLGLRYLFLTTPFITLHLILIQVGFWENPYLSKTYSCSYLTGIWAILLSMLLQQALTINLSEISFLPWCQLSLLGVKVYTSDLSTQDFEFEAKWAIQDPTPVVTCFLCLVYLLMAFLLASSYTPKSFWGLLKTAYENYVAPQQNRICNL